MRGQGGRAVGFGFLTLGVVYPALRLALVLTGPMDRVRQDFADDAYYYALIAHHIARGEGSTFGGLVPTNGYQPLWQLLVVPVAVVSEGDHQVRLTFVLSALLFALVVWLAWRISRALGAETEGLYATVYATMVGSILGEQFFNGMEFALVVPAGMLVLLHLLRWSERGDRLPGGASRYGVLLGLAVLLLGLSRLDALALPAAAGLLILLRRPIGRIAGRVAWRVWLIAALVAGAGMLGYAGWNLLRFGTPVPVSGLAKALGGGSADSAASIVVNYLRFGDVGPVSALWLGAQAVLVSAAALWLLRRARRAQAPLFGADRDATLSWLLQALFLAQLLQLGYYAVTSSWPLWEWYYYYIPWQFLVAGLVLARAVLRRSTSSGSRSASSGSPSTSSESPSTSSGSRLVAAVIAGLAAVSGLVLFARDNPSTSWTTSSVAQGRWIAANTPPDAVIAMGDRAGGVLWASQRRSVQLEGLVQDQPYLAVLQDRAIAGYLETQSVDYYVRGSTAGDPTGRTPAPGRPGCWSLTEPGQGDGPKSAIVVCDEDLVHTARQDDGSLWQMWRFRSELQTR